MIFPLVVDRVSVKPRRWLISKRADFWFASSGASLALLAALALITFYGDRELDWLDLVLSELHLGATYNAVLSRRLWRRFPIDVLIVPAVILVATYALMAGGQWVLLTSIAMYAAIWHRGRQSFGIARFYQRQAGGPISRLHAWLFAGAIYLPMAAAIFLYGHLAPENYEGEPYYGVERRGGSYVGIGTNRCRLGFRLSCLDSEAEPSGSPIEPWPEKGKLKRCIRVSTGLCSRTLWLLAVPTC